MAEADPPVSAPSQEGPADSGGSPALPPAAPTPAAQEAATFPEPAVGVAPPVAAPQQPSAAPPAIYDDSGRVSSHDRRRRVRWMDTGITLLLCGAVATVLLVAAPPLLRAAGMGPTAKSAGLDPLGMPRGASSAQRDRQFFAGDEELEENLSSPHRGRPVWSDNDEDQRPAEGHGDAGARVGMVRRPIKLFDHPGADGGDVVGEVGSGETVLLVTELGEWVLVVHSGSSDVSMGWTRKSDIAIR